MNKIDHLEPSVSYSQTTASCESCGLGRSQVVEKMFCIEPIRSQQDRGHRNTDCNTLHREEVRLELVQFSESDNTLGTM